MTTFDPNKVPHFFLGFNSYGHVSSDPNVAEVLNSEDYDDGIPANVIVEIVTESCRRQGLEYICDQNLIEDETLVFDENGLVPAISLKDWVNLMSRG